MFDDFSMVTKRLKEAQDSEQDLREAAKEAQLFITAPNGQWEPEWYDKCRDKPRYTFDQTTPIVKQIYGDIRDSDFAVEVEPRDTNATKDYAQFREGLIRNIEKISNARYVYSNAAKNMVVGGIDHWLLETDYVDENSFDQDIFIKPIYNSAFRVWFDPAAQERDRSDAKYAFLLSSLTKNDYDEQFPEGSGLGVGDSSQSEVYYEKADQIEIGHMYYKKNKPKWLIKTNFGRVFTLEEYEEVRDALAMAGEYETDRKQRTDTTVYMRKFDGGGWLADEEETVFDSIPIVPVYGNYNVIENKPIYHGAVMKLMDAQRVFNYSLSREIEEGALAPRAKLVMTPKQIEGHTDELRTINVNSTPVLLYNPDAEASPPYKIDGAQINQGLRVLSEGMRDIIGQNAGIFAAGMGDNPNLQSGVAIERLQDKSNNMIGDYIEAMEIAITRTAQLINEALPKVYTPERQVRIANADGTFDISVVGQVVGDKVINDLTRGKYDVTVSAAPSFASRQSETVNAFINLAQVDPSIMQIGSDVLLKNMRAAGMDEVADRVRQQMLNSGVIPQNQMTEEELIIMQQAQGQQQPDAAMLLAQAEQAKADAEMSKAQVAAMKAQADAQIKMGEISLKEQELMLKAQETEQKAYDLQIKERELMLKLEQQQFKLQQDEADLNLKAEAQALEGQIAMLREQRENMNAACERVKKSADALKTIREAMGADAIMSPQAAMAYEQQVDELMREQIQY